MRKLILNLAISLDGFIEGPKGEYDWCFTDQDYGLSQLFHRVDARFMGRKTYEMMLKAGDSGSGMPPMKDYIFSNSLEKVKQGMTLVKGNLVTEVNKIKNETGKDIWLFGGAELTHSLLQFGLVDELSLAVHPILLGGGKRLFESISQKTLLKHLDTHTYSTGLVVLSYAIE